MYVYTLEVDPQNGKDNFISDVYPYSPASRLCITREVEAYEEEGCKAMVYLDELKPEGRKTIRKVYPIMEPTYEW